MLSSGPQTVRSADRAGALSPAAKPHGKSDMPASKPVIKKHPKVEYAEDESGKARRIVSSAAPESLVTQRPISYGTDGGLADEEFSSDAARARPELIKQPPRQRRQLSPPRAARFNQGAVTKNLAALKEK